jgi:hypothetical protein
LIIGYRAKGERATRAQARHVTRKKLAHSVAKTYPYVNRILDTSVRGRAVH